MAWHLRHWLKLEGKTEIIPFDRALFSDAVALTQWVQRCDTIVHLAGLNRHSDPEEIYAVNVALAKKLTDACRQAQVRPHIIFSSSTQEERETIYGNSKRDGRLIFEQWSRETGATLTSLIIPNVFGPFGVPFYNSVVATFAHQIATGATPEIHVDGELKLIYVQQLVEKITQLIHQPVSATVQVTHQYVAKVSEILEILNNFKTQYQDKGEFPALSSPFHLALFNTYRTYIPHDFYPRPFKLNTDNRGTFVEVARTHSEGQFSYSTTKPGITRGNHFHTRKAERFAVIKGKAKISLRKYGTQEVIDYYLDGDAPAYVDMPVWYVHNITNVGDTELLTLFWINEPYNPEDPDTFFETV